LVDVKGKLLPTQQKHVFVALIMNYPSGVLRIVFEGKKIACSKERKAKFNIRLGATTEHNDVFAIVTVILKRMKTWMKVLIVGLNKLTTSMKIR